MDSTLRTKECELCELRELRFLLQLRFVVDQFVVDEMDVGYGSPGSGGAAACRRFVAGDRAKGTQSAT
jgi:hypothetical protein